MTSPALTGSGHAASEEEFARVGKHVVRRVQFRFFLLHHWSRSGLLLGGFWRSRLAVVVVVMFSGRIGCDDAGLFEFERRARVTSMRDGTRTLPFPLAFLLGSAAPRARRHVVLFVVDRFQLSQVGCVGWRGWWRRG